jgi:hypothetical protein
MLKLVNEVAYLIRKSINSTYNGKRIVECIHERMDGYDCDIESETCHRAEKVNECWISMVALNEMLLFFWDYENRYEVTYDAFRAKPWTMMIWIKGGLRY